MKFTLSRAFVVLSLFTGLATGANAQSTPSVDRLFDQITLELMAKDYLPRTKPMALQVAPDSEMPAQVALDPAHVYLVVAVCGLGCKNIDIGWAELDAPANTWLRRETQVAQTALLELVPQKKGDYMLAFTTPGCTRAACDFAFRVYYKPRPLSMF